MSIKLSALVASIILVFCMLLNLTLSFPFELQQISDRGSNINKEPTEWSDVGVERSVPDKKDCAGFPCMYTHMAEKAGRASLYRTLARLIDDCMANPSCNPGRRRKRSVRTAHH